MKALRALAPAKVNLGLFVGPRRAGDGRHELVTVMQSVSLADELVLEVAPGGASADEVLCPGVELGSQENLAAAALRAFRAHTSWDAPPLRLRIDKRIPVAAGLGGGSADAAAALRLAARASGIGDARLLVTIARELGADVPAQVVPGRWLARGAGELLQELPAPAAPLTVLIVPLDAALATAEVYRAADRADAPRSLAELDALAASLAAALAGGAPLPASAGLLHNDLEGAARSLCPRIDEALELVLAAGAGHALVSGSGPTVIGVFAAERHEAERRAALGAAGQALRERAPAPAWASAVGASGAWPDGAVRHNLTHSK